LYAGVRGAAANRNVARGILLTPPPPAFAEPGAHSALSGQAAFAALPEPAGASAAHPRRWTRSTVDVLLTQVLQDGTEGTHNSGSERRAQRTDPLPAGWPVRFAAP